MLYLQIIINRPVNQPFTYSYTAQQDEKPELRPEVGKRAEIMFGNQKLTGFIMEITEQIPESCPVDASKIRPVKRILDKEALFGPELFEMAKWLSHYYLCTLGEAVFSMIPSGRRETSAGGFSFENELTVPQKNILSDEQKDAVEEILASQNTASGQAKLFHYLYGPTGTGKTEVFLTLAERILSQGKGIIYLVPEISLTGQVATSIAERFGNTA